MGRTWSDFSAMSRELPALVNYGKLDKAAAVAMRCVAEASAAAVAPQP